MKIREYRIISSKIKKQYKIALLSDYHNAPYRKIIEIFPGNIDLILIPGDFCMRFFKGMWNHGRVIDFIQELVKMAPVYCSMGNHDKASMSDSDFVKLIEKAGAKLLLNESVDWAELHIAGWYHQSASPFQVNDLYVDDQFNILLSHKPEWFPQYLQESKFELVLSGHAHGGQWNLLNTPIFASGQGLFPKLTKGLYFDRLLVTTGVSNPVVIPRFGNPKEIVLLSLLPSN